MTRRRAKLLAFLAGRRRRDGTRGRLAGRAVRILIRTAKYYDPYPHDAYYALLDLWLRYPDDEGWEFFGQRWRSISASREQFVLDEAVNPRQPARTRAAIGAFCVRHDLVPDGAVDRALFFVLTGQASLHRAHDPDGSLLATGYRGAEDLRREVLRQAMLDAGDLDLVRAVVVDRPNRMRTAGEIDYLARRLADAREWAELWQLIRDAPVVPAVAAMALFDGWRPAEQALFARFAAARPDTVAAAAEAVELGGRAQIPHVHASDVSFAPDRSQVAICGFGSSLEVYTIPGGRRITQSRPHAVRMGPVAHFGDGIIVAERDRYGFHEPGRLVRYRGARRAVVWTGRYPHDVARILVKVGAGFVAAMGDGLLLGERQVRLNGQPPLGSWSGDFRLVAEPGSGRLALGSCDGGDLVILDEELRIVARYEGDEYGEVGRLDDVVFAGPDQLITLGKDGTVCLWRRAGDTLEVMATARAAEVLPAPFELPEQPWTTDVPRLCVLPELGLVAAVGHGGVVVCLRTDPLALADLPRELADDPADGLWSSEDGSHLAIARANGHLDVHDLRLRDVADVVPAPMGSMSIADLAAVTAVERRDFPQNVRELFGLLRACLEHRFATEIRLGGAAGQRAAADDIALGGRE
jgi:hypothetical protein